MAPSTDHVIDAIRAEDVISQRLGYEEHIPGQTRDWNEELQTTRELTRKTLPDRLIRERAIFKVRCKKQQGRKNFKKRLGSFLDYLVSQEKAVKVGLTDSRNAIFVRAFGSKGINLAQLIFWKQEVKSQQKKSEDGSRSCSETN